VQDFPTLTGRGESIAVIDTGIDYNQAVLGGGTGRGYKVRAGYNFIDDNYDYMDHDGTGRRWPGSSRRTRTRTTTTGIRAWPRTAQLIALKVDDG